MYKIISISYTCQLYLNKSEKSQNKNKAILGFTAGHNEWIFKFQT